ncbi:hypothetical protein C3K47_19060 [Solitalea longa]|uniref:Uncharacterized protein n=1 Tax=Solitalea longa TaxID=2079460 RepID=A0A2S4ZXP0_9SPHI|nr:hypothetical protein C3K47_19060 [Solitalea longa]
MNMMQEFYYWMYKGLKRIRKEENPSFDAVLGVVFFINLNIMVIGRLAYNYTHFKISKDHVIVIAIIYALMFLSVSSFYFLRNRTKIFERINTYPAKRLRKGKYVFIAYVILSLVSFYSLVFLE